MAFLFAKGIKVKILFVRNEQKDCNVKPDPKGFDQIKIGYVTLLTIKTDTQQQQLILHLPTDLLF